MQRRSLELRLQQTASSLTLLTLLAIVPVASMGLLVLTALPALADTRRSLERFLAEQLFLPSFSGPLLKHLNQFAAAAEGLSALGTLAFFATAMMAMLTIDRTLNGIWRAPRPRALSYRLVLYWAFLTLGPVLMGAALALQFKVANRLHGLEDRGALVWAAESAVRLVPVALLVLGLTAVYRLVPNALVRWRDAALGALTAVLLLLALKHGLMIYLAWVPTYTLVYGAFAALPLFLLWVFALWLSVLWGAVLAAHAGAAQGGAALPDGSPAAAFERMRAVLMVLVRAQPQYLRAADCRACLAGQAAWAEEAATTLADLGYLVRSAPRAAGGCAVWDEWWLGAPGLGSMSLMPLFERVWGRPAHAAAAHACAVAGPALARPLAEWWLVPGKEECDATGQTHV